VGGRPVAGAPELSSELSLWYYCKSDGRSRRLGTRSESTDCSPEQPQDAIVEKLSSGKRRKFARFVVAALSSIPWIGGVFSAAASFSAEKDQEGFNELEALWLKGHEEKIKELGETLTDIFTRLENFGDEIQDRIESP